MFWNNLKKEKESLAAQCRQLQEERSMLLCQIEEYKLFIQGTVVPLSSLVQITDTPLSILSFWCERKLLPVSSLDDRYFISGEAVRLLLTDEQGRLHLRDEFHKPLSLPMQSM